jgi:hypothetical protein
MNTEPYRQSETPTEPCDAPCDSEAPTTPCGKDEHEVVVHIPPSRLPLDLFSYISEE